MLDTSRRLRGIMSLRKARRWVGEFLVVVLGVFVALVADRWQGASSDRRMEHAYLDRLRTEIAEDTTRLSLLMSRAEEKRVALQNLHRALSATQAQSTDLGQYIRTALISLEQDFRTTTYDDLLGTGRWGLIRDPDLRSAVISYFEHIERYVPRIESRKSDLPAIVINHLPPSEWNASTLTPEFVDGSVDLILRDPAFAAAINREYYYSSYAQRYFALIRQKGVEAIHHIGTRH